MLIKIEGLDAGGGVRLNPDHITAVYKIHEDDDEVRVEMASGTTWQFSGPIDALLKRFGFS